MKLNNLCHLETIIVATFNIALADGGQQFPCAADDTILRAALRAGVGLPYECNAGGCGTCKIELVAGEVASNWPGAPALGERDVARKRVLGCQSRPQSATAPSRRAAAPSTPRRACRAASAPRWRRPAS